MDPAGLGCWGGGSTEEVQGKGGWKEMALRSRGIENLRRGREAEEEEAMEMGSRRGIPSPQSKVERSPVQSPALCPVSAAEILQLFSVLPGIVLNYLRNQWHSGQIKSNLLYKLPNYQTQ